MKKNSLLILLFCLLSIYSQAQIIKYKVIDDGGSGPYKAFGVTEKTLPNFVVYRPENIKKAVKKEGKLPILVWANGGCMNSSIHHEHLLSEIASHGYIIIAIGELQMTVEERTHEHTDNEELFRAIDWIKKQAINVKSNYFKNVNINKMAAAGQSCGGAQIMRIAGNKYITNYMMFNSGMGDMTMAGASSNSLKNLNGKVIYIVGGESDVAYKNALLDYERISNVPVVLANLSEGGHGGTFGEKFGGSFAQMALDWLNWQFKRKDKSALFVDYDLSSYPGWTIKSKNFK